MKNIGKYIKLYIGLYFKFILIRQSFFVILIFGFAPLIFSAIMDGANHSAFSSHGNHTASVNLITGMYEFYMNYFMNLAKSIQSFFNLKEYQIIIIFVLFIGIINYMIFMLFFFILIELFYLKYRLKGYTTQEIKQIYKLKELEKDKNSFY